MSYKNEWGEEWFKPEAARKLLASRGVWFSNKDMKRRVFNGEFKGRARMILCRSVGVTSIMLVSKESVLSWLRNRYWDCTIKMYRKAPYNRRRRNKWYQSQEPGYVLITRRFEISYEYSGFEVIPENRSVLNGLGRVSYLLNRLRTRGTAWDTWQKSYSKHAKST